MSRSERFLNGVAFAYGYQALVMVMGLWLTPFLLRHLGQHDYGLWLVGLQVLTYLMLADFGIVALLPRNVAQATGRAGGATADSELPVMIGQTAVIVLWQALIVACGAGLVWIFFPRDWMSLRGPIGMVLAGVTLLFPFRIFAAILEGLQQQAFTIRASMIGWGLSTAANVAAVQAGFGLYALAIGWLMAQVFCAAACAYRLRKRYPEVFPSRLPSMRIADAIPQLGRGFWISANQLGQILLSGSDILIIGRFLGPAFVVPYSCTAKLANVLTNQPQVLMHMAVPGLSELKAGSSNERVYQVSVSLSQGMMLVSGIVVCVILVVNRGFVDWWVGPERYAGMTLTSLILAQLLLRHFNLTVAYATFCFGYERRMAITGLVDGLVTAGAVLALTPWLGYTGAAAGSILGVCLVSLPVNMITLARELKVSVKSLGTPLWPWFWRFALLSAGSAVFANYWTPHTVIQIASTGASVALLYLVVLARPTMRTALGPYLRIGMTQVMSRFQRTTPDLDIEIT